ncbi:MAG: TetR/AcrR family transcriptional regulator [Parvibaculum sp.]|nr:TetR/AcrR family transcriptional regulator [Parvibaculum sp.]
MSVPPDPATPNQGLIRRQPTQERAKARVERILAAASELIAETGSDAVRMTEIAVRAGIPIGSLYQYFPDKSAVLRVLISRFMANTREMLTEALKSVKDKEGAIATLDGLIAGHYLTFMNTPVVRDIWSGAQADKALQMLDLEDSRACGQLLFDTFKSMVPESEHERLGAICFLMVQMAGATVRLAIVLDRKEGDLLVSEFRRVVRTEISNFLIY